VNDESEENENEMNANSTGRGSGVRTCIGNRIVFTIMCYNNV